MTLRRWLRSILIAAVVTVVAMTALVVAMTSSGSAADLTYRTLDYDVHIAANGDMTVVQHIDMRLKDRGDGDTRRPWKQLYQQYTLKAKNLTSITNVSVTDRDTGRQYQQIAPQSPSSVDSAQWDAQYANHWYVSDVTDGADSPLPYDAQETAKSLDSGNRTIEVGWNIPATTKADHMRFDVAMTFTGTATAYDDVASIQWEPVGASNQIPIGELSASVHFPKGVTASNSWAWLHFSGRSTTSRDSDGTLHATASDVRNGQYLDLVTIFDVAASKGITRSVAGDAKTRIMRDEAAQERAWQDSQRARARRVLITAIIAGVLGLALVCLGLAAAIRSNRDAQYRGDVEYWRDPPEMSPASAAALLAIMQPVPAKRLASRQLAATVMSLASKHAIAMLPGAVEDYQGLDVMNMQAQEVSAVMRQRLDPRRKRASTNTVVILPVTRNNRGMLRLSESEEGALQLLEVASQRLNSPVFDLKGMQRSFSGWQEGVKVQGRYQAAVDNEFAALGATSSTGIWARVSGGCGLALAALCAVTAAVSGQLALALLVAGPLCFGSCVVLAAARSVSLSARGQVLAGQVVGLQRYLEQFSDFSERDVDDLVLWDRYLVYAVAFGISGTVLRQMAKMNPHLADPQWLDAYAGTSLMYWLYRPYLWESPAFAGGGVISDAAQAAATGSLSANVGDIGAQLSSSFADLSHTIQLASPSSSSGSGSGMFSGGGFGGMSGGSGGGSFGGR